jgi:hypothetical protein
MQIKNLNNHKIRDKEMIWIFFLEIKIFEFFRAQIKRRETFSKNEPINNICKI